MGGKLRTWKDQRPMMQALRTGRRFELFSGIHSLIATTPTGSPLSITSPAWRAPLNSSNEREMMLMIHPLGGNISRPHPSVHRTRDFLYSTLYGDSFGGVDTAVELKNYRPYVQRLLEQVKRSAVDSKWGAIPSFEDLITQAKAEGLWTEITLITAEK